MNSIQAQAAHDNARRSVMVHVAVEQETARAKHGDQTHRPDGTGPSGVFVTGNTFAVLAKASRARTDRAAESGVVTYAHILLEEVFEAMECEPTSGELYSELVQVAAVAQTWAQKVRADIIRKAVQDAEAEAGSSEGA